MHDIDNSIEIMSDKAKTVSEFMKCFASPHRLVILCHLAQGEKNVSELIDLTGMAQTSVSQHLSKLKNEGLVDYRREHRVLYYSICNEDALKVMSCLYDIYCKDISKS